MARLDAISFFFGAVNREGAGDTVQLDVSLIVSRKSHQCTFKL